MTVAQASAVFGASCGFLMLAWASYYMSTRR